MTACMAKLLRRELHDVLVHAFKDVNDLLVIVACQLCNREVVVHEVFLKLGRQFGKSLSLPTPVLALSQGKAIVDEFKVCPERLRWKKKRGIGRPDRIVSMRYAFAARGHTALR